MEHNNVGESFLAGLFVFVMVAVILGSLDAIVSLFSDNTMLTIAGVLGIVTTTYKVVTQ